MHWNSAQKCVKRVQLVKESNNSANIQPKSTKFYMNIDADPLTDTLDMPWLATSGRHSSKLPPPTGLGRILVPLRFAEPKQLVASCLVAASLFYTFQSQCTHSTYDARQSDIHWVGITRPALCLARIAICSADQQQPPASWWVVTSFPVWLIYIVVEVHVRSFHRSF